MDICSGNKFAEIHDEIVFEGKDCPLCVEIEKRQGIEKERDKLQDELDNIE